MAVMLRDVWDLLAGFAVITALVYGFTLLLAKLAPAPEGAPGSSQPWYMVATLGWSFAAAIAGGYVTAWAAMGNPLPKVLMLAIVVLAVSAISALDARGRKPVGPQLAGAVLGAAGVVIGGLIRLRVLGLV